ncbi:MAG: hypothetical protein DMD78_07595 [Candidatus Rokuibacteriota bacterium]|nr:MAG: hypothetical protein DMD78_07595 [Candidatus Rokubacteria bacterium]
MPAAADDPGRRRLIASLAALLTSGEPPEPALVQPVADRPRLGSATTSRWTSDSVARSCTHVVQRRRGAPEFRGASFMRSRN